ncbi:MAG TPA: PQQ-dependent sugar dehydrogenase [Candidatus Limnocylindrales bacterium]
MRGVAFAAALVLALAGCGTAPYDRLPDSAFVDAPGGVVIEDWPSVARRPYDGDGAGGMPPRFHERPVLRGLVQPTAVRFAPDGRIFVAEQRGTIVVFDSFEDTTPTLVADLRREVLNWSELGLLGLALDPDFATQPYLYIAYTRDAPIGGVAPVYGGSSDADVCADPDRCFLSARLSRMLLGSDGRAGGEQVLIEDWCHDGGHSVGTVLFGADGALYAGAGDTAGPIHVEYGQRSVPPNPCADPPTAAGEMPSPPSAEGGSLRSQDLRTRADPVGLSGTIVRVDRASGEGLADNPLAGDADANARRVVAYGLRNPYRFTFRPGTSELWIADVGWTAYEEIDVIADPLAPAVANLGWPCYEGPYRQPQYEAVGFDICRDLYAEDGAVLQPWVSFGRSETGTAACDSSGTSLSGLAFYDAALFPAEYAGALFFADATRACVWVIRAGADGRPDINTVRIFRTGLAVVDMQVGADGALYLLDYAGGTLRRVAYYAGRQPPRARLRGSATHGPAPLTVSLDAGRSSDADGDALTFAWDTDDDGTFDEGSGAQLLITLPATPGRYPIRVRVTDADGEWAEAAYTLRVDAPP